MTNPPPIELLEASHEFPGPFTFKVIGKSVEGFVARMISLIRDELDLDVDPPFHTRETSGGKYLSVTLTPQVQRPEQVLAIYSRISQTDDVVMTL